MPTSTPPNLYHLQGRGLHVSYSTTGIDGRPHFSYQDATQTLGFTGDEIRTVECDLGILVSVSIRRTVDSGSTSFSVLLPRVELEGNAPAHVSTQAVTTVHRFSVIAAFNRGQLDSYHVTSLRGTASIVVF